MRQVFVFVLALVLAVLFAAATVAALGFTAITIKDAVESEGSLAAFEARVRHYTDRLELDGHGFRLVRSPHPFLLHFGLLALSWVVSICAAAALQKLQHHALPVPSRRT
jgi:hypothetical protein